LSSINVIETLWSFFLADEYYNISAVQWHVNLSRWFGHSELSTPVNV